MPAPTPSQRRRLPALRRPAVFACALAILVALFAGRAAMGAATFAGAPDIVFECANAKGALAAARTVGAPSSPVFRSALRAARARADEAYRLASSATWGQDVAAERGEVLESLSATQSNLARLDESKRRWKRARIRGTLDAESARLSRVMATLRTLYPPRAQEPAPAPTPGPTPVPPPPPAPSAEMPLLPAGAGFDGPTGPFSQIGTGAAATQTAIARWDVVPNQTITTTFPVGVVAFHVNGIDRVEFSLTGGAWQATATMTTNSVTGVREYNALIDPSTLPAGEFEVRAVAYPSRGVPRVLDSLVLVARPSGTPDPKCWVDPVWGDNDSAAAGDPSRAAATIYGAVKVIAYANHAAGRGKTAGGGTIYLMAGHYSPGRTLGTQEWVDDAIETHNSRWLTITRDPSTPKSDVVIDQRGGLGLLRTRYADLTIHVAEEATYGLFITSAPPHGIGGYVWLSDCDVSAYTRYDGNAYLFMNGWLGAYRDGCTFTEMAFGEAAVLARGDRFEGIVADIWSGCGMVIDGVASDVSRIGTPAHTDIYQFMTPDDDGIENIILYGVTAKSGIAAQGLFCGGGEHLRDVAFVNVDIDNGYGAQFDIADAAVQMNSPTRHMYFKDCTISGWCWLRPETSFTAEDVVIENTTLVSHVDGMMDPGLLEGVSYR